jgi:alanyl-tRNA synthetase
MTLTSNQIRSQFFKFFEEKGHKIVPSAPIVQKNDPTLMFTNAGMNQFKDFFLGNRTPQNNRVANSQKCLRVSGKHNDLEEVGVDTYHHTMFEMLGNWSFGDYFKEEAISWAWELLTEVYKLDKNRLYVSVFGGDETDGLGLDIEAQNIWKEFLPEERILAFGKKENFWEMGEVGPCGPCSEIHIDLRPEKERELVDGKTLVNKDHPLVIEIWNLVFIQYNRKSDSKLVGLPNKHVDTGMGLERLVMAMQSKSSNYDTDIFSEIISQIENISNIKYQSSSSKQDVAIRVIADHLRAVAFCIADGQLPSNNGAGYVVRRILRRAIRYAYSFLNIQSSFIYALVPALVDKLGENFEELTAQVELIKNVIKEEEENFLNTLEKGIDRLIQVVKQTDSNGISGKVVFELYDTFGFPVDLTNLILADFDKEADMVGFEEELQKQKERSKSATALKTDDWVELIDDKVEEFVGYDKLETKVRVTKYRKVSQKNKSFFQLVFNLTPFYPEGGGQVGDTGEIVSSVESVRIFDTKKENDLIIHFVEALPEQIDALFTAKVDSKKRLNTARNHSATHLLHHALRSILGKHVEQKGSLVASDYLRFDFSHFQKIHEDDLFNIEKMVNDQIMENYTLNEKRGVPMDEAKEMGAMALFGEKYGDIVRVINFGDSVELCGGTHVKATGNIGYFKIVSESAVASGIRRIEALTGDAAMDFLCKNISLMNEIRHVLKSKNPLKSIEELVDKTKKLENEIESLTKQNAQNLKGELISKIENFNGIKLLRQKVDLDSKSIKDLAFQLKSENTQIAILLVADNNGKANLNLAFSDDLIKNNGYHAGNFIRTLAKEVNGGGGGQPFFASAGGSSPENLHLVLKKIEELL